jgi:hypothetical protein
MDTFDTIAAARDHIEKTSIYRGPFGTLAGSIGGLLGGTAVTEKVVASHLGATKLPAWLAKLIPAGTKGSYTGLTGTYVGGKGLSSVSGGQAALLAAPGLGVAAAGIGLGTLVDRAVTSSQAKKLLRSIKTMKPLTTEQAHEIKKLKGLMEGKWTQYSPTKGEKLLLEGVDKRKKIHKAMGMGAAGAAGLGAVAAAIKAEDEDEKVAALDMIAAARDHLEKTAGNPLTGGMMTRPKAFFASMLFGSKVKPGWRGEALRTLERRDAFYGAMDRADELARRRGLGFFKRRALRSRAAERAATQAAEQQAMRMKLVARRGQRPAVATGSILGAEVGAFAPDPMRVALVSG